MVRPSEEVEALLQEYAELIAITGGEAFKARAYEKAARVIGGRPADVSHLDATGPRAIPGVGKSIADKVVEYFRTGKVTVVEEKGARIPDGVRELMTIPPLGPKKAMALYEELHVSSWTSRPTPSRRRGCVTCGASVHSHSTPQLAYLRYGVGTAQQRGRLPHDVINTWPLRRLRRFLCKDRTDRTS